MRRLLFMYKPAKSYIHVCIYPYKQRSGEGEVDKRIELLDLQELLV